MRIGIAALLFVLSAMPVRAEDCLGMMLRFDKAIQTAQVSAEAKEQAQSLREQGEEQRATGGDCETPLTQALQLIGQ